MKHGQITGSELIVAGGNASKLLQAIDQALHTIALAICFTVEGTGVGLVRAVRDGVANAASSQEVAHGWEAVTFVSHDPLRAFPRTSTSSSFHHPLGQQLLKGCKFVAFTAGQDEGDGLALPLGPDMDLGAETPLRTA